VLISQPIHTGDLEELFEVETAAPILTLERRVIGHHPRFQPAIAGPHSLEFDAEFAGAAHAPEPRVGEVRDFARAHHSGGDDDGTLSSGDVA
jgi:hypothetical protein